MAVKKKRQIIYKKLNIDRKWLFIILFLAVLSFFIDIWQIIFLCMFSVGNAFLLTIDRYINAPVDIELSTFAAVIMTQLYTLKWGIAVAILSKVAAIIYNKKFSVDHLFMMGGYIVAALIASIAPGSIVVAGIISTIVVNLYVVFVSKYITHLSTYEIVMYGSSNTIFNVVLFIGFGEIIFKLMGLF
ncbi:hypothetical protein HN789_05125 [archaeon]|jgi:hypothetical protein|nr:hypothetical protein [archaeon]MBT4022893.1 hypothetical protein [archaeon]MBT4272540.1 hypothetical protein [archaeon]MBT4460392.1 hypothetical protein [archaeon]MBT4859023.1 hypothetical protein [archaeon]